MQTLIQIIQDTFENVDFTEFMACIAFRIEGLGRYNVIIKLSTLRAVLLHLYF